MRHILEIVRNWFAEMAKLEAALPRVAGIPALLLWGDRDGAVEPASAAPLQRVLRHSELHVFSGGGHILFEEFPQQTNRILLEWLRRDPLPSPLNQTTTALTAGTQFASSPNVSWSHDRISACIRSSFAPGESAVP